MHYLTKLNNLEDTALIAKCIATSILPNMVITLSGDLGAGKTTIIRHILQELGIKGSIKSPTYTIVEPYKINDLEIYHFDLYRFNEPNEWFECGFDEYFKNNIVCFIEWADKASSYIPTIDLKIAIGIIDTARNLEIIALTEKGTNAIKIMANSLVSK